MSYNNGTTKKNNKNFLRERGVYKLKFFKKVADI